MISTACPPVTTTGTPLLGARPDRQALFSTRLQLVIALRLSPSAPLFLARLLPPARLIAPSTRLIALLTLFSARFSPKKVAQPNFATKPRCSFTFLHCRTYCGISGFYLTFSLSGILYNQQSFYLFYQGKLKPDRKRGDPVFSLYK